MTDSKLNHLLMILIYNEELDEINVKLRTNKLMKEKESRIATFGLYQFWAFACFSLFIVTAWLVSSLCFLSITPEIIKVFLWFQGVLKGNIGTKWVNVSMKYITAQKMKNFSYLFLVQTTQKISNFIFCAVCTKPNDARLPLCTHVCL